MRSSIGLAIPRQVGERLEEEIPGLQMVGLVHDEVLLLAPEGHAERAEGWLTGITEGALDSVVQGDRPPGERVRSYALSLASQHPAARDLFTPLHRASAPILPATDGARGADRLRPCGRLFFGGALGGGPGRVHLGA